MDALVRYEVDGEKKSWLMDIDEAYHIWGAYDSSRYYNTDDKNALRALVSLLKIVEMEEYKHHHTNPVLIAVDAATEEQVEDWKREMQEYREDIEKNESNH